MSATQDSASLTFCRCSASVEYNHFHRNKKSILYSVGNNCIPLKQQIDKCEACEAQYVIINQETLLGPPVHSLKEMQIFARSLNAFECSHRWRVPEWLQENSKPNFHLSINTRTCKLFTACIIQSIDHKVQNCNKSMSVTRRLMSLDTCLLEFAIFWSEWPVCWA